MASKLLEIWSGLFILTFYPSRIQGSKRHRIPNPDPQNCIIVGKKLGENLVSPLAREEGSMLIILLAGNEIRKQIMWEVGRGSVKRRMGGGVGGF